MWENLKHNEIMKEDTIMIIREMNFFDLDDVVEIEKESFSDAWSKIGYEACLKNEFNHYFVGENKGEIVGVFGFSVVVDEAELHTISVKKSCRNQGIATKFIKFMLDYCKKENVNNIFLEVRESNFEAINLYTKFGFQKNGRINGYYETPRENALRMMLNMDDIKQNIITLAIETSCDETSVAIVKNGREVLSNVISSQIDVHKRYGGVVPEVASRLHLEAMNSILQQSLDEAGLSLKDIDVICVTKGPGLIGALLVGISCAKSLSYCLKKPLVGVNHMQGHICANYISHKELEPPFISLVVSGGHTYLIDVVDYQDYEIIGSTRDDACGESYDKVARALGLEYPGGPVIDRLAKQGNPTAIDFPRVMLEKDSYDFSFSGLKTAVLNYLNNKNQKNEEIIKEDVAASFQEAVIDVLVEKSFRLLEEKNQKTFVLSGGVAANSRLKERVLEKAEEKGIQVYFPDKILCTDNAAMIATAGYYDFINGKQDGLDLKVYPNLEL